MNCDMQNVSPKTFWQIFFAATLLAAATGLIQTAQRFAELQVSLWRSRWILLAVLFLVNVVGGFLVLIRFPRRLETLQPASLNKPLGGALILFGLALPWLFRFFVFGQVLPQTAPLLWVFLWATLVQTFGLRLFGGYPLRDAFAFLVLFQGLTYHLYGSLTVVSVYPFSIGYSEASRHYYASMFHAESLYGVKLPYPFLHPTRYMLLSLPFWIPGLPLWAHRLWQSVLWVALTGASALLLARRGGFKGWAFFFLAAWAYVYYLQGAVYYHLQVCVILVLAGFSSERFWRSLLFVALASFWAGMSRVNWFPVPAMLAIALYLLENEINGRGWKYWLPPFVYGVSGLALALAGQFFYIAVSGNADLRSFGSSFTSDLLWNRLLPNEIFSGVLPGIALVTAPLLASLYQNLRGNAAQIHPLRQLALLGLILVLFLGGLVVSVKIGGGGDLHNMDAYLVLLALIAVYFFAGRVKTEAGGMFAGGRVSPWVVAAALLIPMIYALPRLSSFFRYDSAAARQDVQTLQTYAERAEGEVLFLTERQLFTFGELKNLRLIPEYEQIELMEMAMSGNRPYLEKFYADLNRKRFAVIIAEEQKFVQQKSGAFKEENNAWVKYVGAPLLCAYKPIETLKTANIQVFVPRPNPKCKSPFAP